MYNCLSVNRVSTAKRIAGRTRWEYTMLVNVTDVFTSEGKVVTMEVALELTTVLHQGESFPIAEKEMVRLKLTNQGQGKALAEAAARLSVDLRCDRCLREVKYEFDVTAAVQVMSPDKAGEEQLEDQAGFMEGYELNIDNLINNEIMTSWPMKVLCRPDCKGLCPVCGKDLNTGACGCDTFVPDPRMAAIMDVFNANKEV